MPRPTPSWWEGPLQLPPRSLPRQAEREASPRNCQGEPNCLKVTLHLFEQAMAKYTVFFDESGDDRIKVFAGFVAANEQWYWFEREWRDVLARFNAPPLHMRTFAHSIAEFADWKGDERRRAGFLEALIGVIRIRTRTSFAAAVLVDDFNDVAARHPDLPQFHTPFAMAGNSCILKVARWAQKYEIPGSDVGLLFEDGAAEKRLFVREAKKHLGITPTFAKKGQFAAFQAADLLAFEYLHSNRAVLAAGADGLSSSDLRKPLQALFDLLPRSAESQWGIHNKGVIEEGWMATKLRPTRGEP